MERRRGDTAPALSRKPQGGTATLNKMSKNAARWMPRHRTGPRDEATLIAWFNPLRTAFCQDASPMPYECTFGAWWSNYFPKKKFTIICQEVDSQIFKLSDYQIGGWSGLRIGHEGNEELDCNRQI